MLVTKTKCQSWSTTASDASQAATASTRLASKREGRTFALNFKNQAANQRTKSVVCTYTCTPPKYPLKILAARSHSALGEDGSRLITWRCSSPFETCTQRTPGRSYLCGCSERWFLPSNHYPCCFGGGDLCSGDWLKHYQPSLARMHFWSLFRKRVHTCGSAR